jgi:hypothetical protein
MDQQLMNFEAPHNKTDTSTLAAEEIKPHLGRLQEMVLSHIINCGVTGATCEEVEKALDLMHQTCSPRVYELHRKGRIKDSGHRRLTSKKRLAIVWVTDNSPESAMGPHKTLGKRHKELKEAYALLKQKFENLEDHSKQQTRAIEHCIVRFHEKVEGGEAELRPEVNDILNRRAQS